MPNKQLHFTNKSRLAQDAIKKWCLIMWFICIPANNWSATDHAFIALGWKCLRETVWGWCVVVDVVGVEVFEGNCLGLVCCGGCGWGRSICGGRILRWGVWEWKYFGGTGSVRNGSFWGGSVRAGYKCIVWRVGSYYVLIIVHGWSFGKTLLTVLN